MKYNIHLDGETQGPFTGAELKAKDLPPDTPCAAESDLSWGKLEEVLASPTPHLRLEGSAMGTLVGGVLMALWLGSILTGSGLAKLLLVMGCLGVLALVDAMRMRGAPPWMKGWRCWNRAASAIIICGFTATPWERA